MCVCTRLFAFLIDCPLSVLSISPPPPQTTNYTRTADENATSPASTQHSTAQGNHLYTSSSWRYRIAIGIKSWASSFCPCHILLYFSLRECGGRRKPPAERSPCNNSIGTAERHNPRPTQPKKPATSASRLEICFRTCHFLHFLT